MENCVIDTVGSRVIPLFAGYESCEPSHSFGPYVRDYYLIHFCLGGKGVLNNTGGVHEVSEGRFFIIRPGEVTTYTADAKTPWEYLWIAFRTEGVEYFRDNTSVYDTPHGLDDRLKAMLFSKQLSSEGSLSVIYELLYSVSNGSDNDGGSEKIRRIRRYIKYNYMLPITVSSLSRDFGFERSYLYRMFKHRYGVGVKEYITEVRLENAKKFLSDGYSVKESAAMVGYEDEFNFSKAFKSRYGVSPSKINTKCKK